MELRELITPAGHGSANADAHLAWYTKDLMVEETSSSPTSSPQLSLDPSPCHSTSSSPLTSDLYSLPTSKPNSGGRSLPAPPMTLTSQPIFSLPRPRIGSSSALLPVSDPRHRQPAPSRQRQPNHKRKRSVSDSLVPSGTRSGRDEDELDVDQLCIDDGDEFDDIERNPVAGARAQLGTDSERLAVSRRDAPSAEDDDESDDDGFVESGEEGDDGHHDGLDLDVGSILPRAVRLQGHESGPPSPPATHYQHGMNENPDGTAYYHCKFCQHTWPQHHFRNAQQFGAHCSNCSRKRKVKDPQDMTTTTRERNKRLRKGKRSRSSSASKASFDQTRHKLIDSDDPSTPECSSQETEPKVRYGQQSTSGGRDPASGPKKFRARAAGARPQQPARILAAAAPVLASGRLSPSTSVGGAAALRSGGEGSMDGLERLFGAMKKRESAEVSQKKKSIFALLACVKTELASLKEQEDGEEIELASREMIQDTRTEWGARIQELRVDAASDLRAHSAALPRRLERLTSLHPRHPGHQQQMRARNSLDFILNGSSSSSSPAETPSPAWAFSAGGGGGRTSFAAVPATPPPSPMSAARHHQQQQQLRGAEVLNLAQPSQSASAPNLRSSGFVPSGHSCAMPASSSLACTSPLTSPL